MISRDTVLPIELKYRTSRIKDQGLVRDRRDLLTLRAQALKEMLTTLKEGLVRQKRLQEEAAEYLNRRRNAYEDLLREGDLVVIFRSELKTSFLAKLAFRQKGLFRIRYVLRDSASYQLKELDRSDKKQTFTRENLKKVALFRIAREPPLTDKEVVAQVEPFRDIYLPQKVDPNLEGFVYPIVKLSAMT